MWCLNLARFLGEEACGLGVALCFGRWYRLIIVLLELAAILRGFVEFVSLRLRCGGGSH